MPRCRGRRLCSRQGEGSGTCLAEHNGGRARGGCREGRAEGVTTFRARAVGEAVARLAVRGPKGRRPRTRPAGGTLSAYCCHPVIGGPKKGQPPPSGTLTLSEVRHAATGFRSWGGGRAEGVVAHRARAVSWNGHALTLPRRRQWSKRTTTTYSLGRRAKHPSSLFAARHERVRARSSTREEEEEERHTESGS